MNPDVEHKKYYRRNPMGNHESPSPETLRFMEAQQDINREIGMKLDEILESVFRLDERVKSFNTIQERIAQLEKGQRKSEKFQQWMKGIFTCLAVVWGVFQYILPFILKQEPIFTNRIYEKIEGKQTSEDPQTESK